MFFFTFTGVFIFFIFERNLFSESDNGALGGRISGQNLLGFGIDTINGFWWAGSVGGRGGGDGDG